MTARPVVYHPRAVELYRSALREARAALHAQRFQHLCEMADLRREAESLRCEVDALRAEHAELRSIMQDVVKTERQRAEGDLAALRRELERALLRLAQRDGTPLH